jgi:hypothetical protein
MMTAIQIAIENYKKDGVSFTDWFMDNYELLLQIEKEQLKEMYLKGIENYDPTFKRKSQWTEVDNMTKRLK